MSDRPTWDVVTAAQAEFGAGGQPRLGEWGVPLIRDGQSWVVPGVVVCWLVDEWGAPSAGKLHLGDPFVALREEDWEARGSRTLCMRKMAQMGRESAGTKNHWVGVPTVLPVGYRAAREVPDGHTWCETCARKVVLLVGGVKALCEMAQAESGVEVRPVVWRSRAVWGVEGEDSYVAADADLTEDVPEAGEDG